MRVRSELLTELLLNRPVIRMFARVRHLIGTVAHVGLDSLLHRTCLAHAPKIGRRADPLHDCQRRRNSRLGRHRVAYVIAGRGAA